MSRGVAYRADMLDDPTTPPDVWNDISGAGVDDPDAAGMYQRRRPSEPMPPPVARRHPEQAHGAPGPMEQRQARYSMPAHPAGEPPHSLHWDTSPKKKGRRQDAEMVELRDVRRRGSAREVRRPSSAGKRDPRPHGQGAKRSSSAGKAEQDERRKGHSSQGKRQRVVERNDSATRLLDAVALDADYYHTERPSSTDDALAPLLQPRPRSAPKLRPVSVDSTDFDSRVTQRGENEQSPIIEQADLDELLISLRDKDETIGDLQERLDSVKKQRPGSEVVEDTAQAKSRNPRFFSLSSPEKYEKSSQVSNLLLRIVQSAHSPLSHCSLSRQAAVVECMHLKELAAGTMLAGCFPDLLTSWRLCAVERGELELRRGETAEIVRRGSILLLPMPADTVCSCRTAVQLWTVDAITLNELQRCDASLRSRENLSLLRTVPEFQQVVNTNIKTFLQSLDERVYDDGDDLQLKGAEAGDNLVHIVKTGEVRKTDRSSRSPVVYSRPNVIIPTIETVNTCRVRAVGEVVCIVMEWGVWQQAMLDPDSHRHAAASPSPAAPPHRPFGFGSTTSSQAGKAGKPSLSKLGARTSIQYESMLGIDVMQLCLSDLRVVGTLGAGAFSRVDLVCIQDQPQSTFALKRLSRQRLIQEKQEDQALREREVLTMIRRDGCHPQIIQLSRTLRDHFSVYFLLEPMLGGDLFSLCRRRGPMKGKQANFYIACVIEALEYLHKYNIVYRGLKPEDILLGKDGYAKLSDFGHSKILEEGATQTYSFCGTADYMTPEQVLEESHGMAVDVWAIGVITYELMCGRTPFSRDDEQHVYAAILKGIDEVGFPSYINGKEARFIRKLCVFEPQLRPGCDEYPTNFDVIRSLPWLKSFQWERLRAGTLSPPFKPHLFGSHDMRYFDSVCPEVEQGVAVSMPLPSSGWDAAF